jgi:hypothetical protein
VHCGCVINVACSWFDKNWCWGILWLTQTRIVCVISKKRKFIKNYETIMSRKQIVILLAVVCCVADSASNKTRNFIATNAGRSKYNFIRSILFKLHFSFTDVSIEICPLTQLRSVIAAAAGSFPTNLDAQIQKIRADAQQYSRLVG